MGQAGGNQGGTVVVGDAFEVGVGGVRGLGWRKEGEE